jgi:AcrR family transcriptional regulator
MSPQEMREILIARTTDIIATEGFDKTTTKAITSGTGINEGYIYRLFSNKEDLLAKTFVTLDEELVTLCTDRFSVMELSEVPFRDRCQLYFNAVWRFLLGNRNKCLAYIRYYYSPYFSKYSAFDHKKRYLPLVEKFTPAFRKEANVWMILNHILNTMLDFAVKVYSDAVPDNEDTAEHVFRLVYTSTEQYFNKEESKTHEKNV